MAEDSVVADIAEADAELDSADTVDVLVGEHVDFLEQRC